MQMSQPHSMLCAKAKHNMHSFLSKILLKVLLLAHLMNSQVEIH